MNETGSLGEITVNDVIRFQPRTVEVFRRYGIDACCGGGLVVADAARRHGVDLDELTRELDRCTS